MVQYGIAKEMPDYFDGIKAGDFTLTRGSLTMQRSLYVGEGRSAPTLAISVLRI